MISSINNSSSTMAMMRSNAMQQQPQGKNVFQLSDTDGNGLVSSAELETLASGIEKTTGSTISVDTALSSFDADQDGALNGEEVFQMMEGMGFAPPEMTTSENGPSSEMPPPPPPPSSEQVTSAYSQNSGDDMLTELLDLLQSQKNNDTNTYSSVNVTS